MIITDKLASSVAAKQEIRPGVAHPQHNGLKNRAEHAHQPTRQPERTMRRFTSAGHTQRFLSAFGPISNHVRPRGHRLKASAYHALMQERFQTWNDVTDITREHQAAEREHFPRALFFFPVNETFFRKTFFSIQYVDHTRREGCDALGPAGLLWDPIHLPPLCSGASTIRVVADLSIQEDLLRDWNRVSFKVSRGN